MSGEELGEPFDARSVRSSDFQHAHATVAISVKNVPNGVSGTGSGRVGRGSVAFVAVKALRRGGRLQVSRFTTSASQGGKDVIGNSEPAKKNRTMAIR